MTFVSNIADDCELFDATQTVTLRVGDGSTQSVTNVTTTRLNAKQTEMYGQIGLDNEMRNFSLAVSKLGGKVPDSTSRITDASGVVWKVGQVELATVGTRYRCTCIKTREAARQVLQWTKVSTSNQALNDSGHGNIAFNSIGQSTAVTANRIDHASADQTALFRSVTVGDTLEITHGGTTYSVVITALTDYIGTTQTYELAFTTGTFPTPSNGTLVTLNFPE